VDFANSHALYPTVTTVNGSAIATGHRIGDTGDFGNTIWVGAAVNPNSPSKFAAVEDDDTLLGLNKQFGGNYLNEQSLMASARAAGFQTAIVGKLGPAVEQDVTARDGLKTIVIDDDTGSPTGVPLDPQVKAAIKAAGLPVVAEDRGLNGDPGDYIRSGVRVANVQQQDWMTAVATKVVLPRFKEKAAPFFMVFWSRDPDGTQHNTGDSLLTLKPGINGPTALAGIRNADNDLGTLRAALKTLGLDQTTDIFVTADHGFSVASKQSATSAAAKRTYNDVPPRFLPQGFLAIDLAKALNLPLLDGAGLPVDLKGGFHVKGDGALLGKDPNHPQVIIAAQGGTDLIWLPQGQGRAAMARRIVRFLTTEDYTSALFVDDALGSIPGTLPISDIGLVGASLIARPTIAVGFKSFDTQCANPEVCVAEVADTYLQQGQGIHGSFSRADTHTFMAAIGPDFKAGFKDPAPVSNADIAPTLAKIMGLTLPSKGALKGRSALEAFAGAGDPAFKVAAHTIKSAPAPGGFVTVLDVQTLTPTTGQPIDYLDAAGMPGRVFGLRP
jgi:arylsulfatase A-like enzyme